MFHTNKMIFGRNFMYSTAHNELIELLRKAYYKHTVAGYGEFFQGELKILNYLNGCEDDTATPSDLCKRLYMTSARVAAALKIAEKKGYILRKPSDTDKRSVYVNITEAGKDYAAQKLAALNCDIEFLLDGLGEEDSKELVRLIGRVIDIFEDKNNNSGVDK